MRKLLTLFTLLPLLTIAQNDAIFDNVKVRNNLTVNGTMTGTVDPGDTILIHIGADSAYYTIDADTTRLQSDNILYLKPVGVNKGFTIASNGVFTFKGVSTTWTTGGLGIYATITNGSSGLTLSDIPVRIIGDSLTIQDASTADEINIWDDGDSARVTSTNPIKVDNIYLGTDLAVKDGGTGVSSFSANQVVTGGTTATGNLTTVTGAAAGLVLTSTGTTSQPGYAIPIRDIKLPIKDGNVISSTLTTLDQSVKDAAVLEYQQSVNDTTAWQFSNTRSYGQMTAQIWWSTTTTGDVVLGVHSNGTADMAAWNDAGPSVTDSTTTSSSGSGVIHFTEIVMTGDYTDPKLVYLEVIRHGISASDNLAASIYIHEVNIKVE